MELRDDLRKERKGKEAKTSRNQDSRLPFCCIYHVGNDTLDSGPNQPRTEQRVQRTG